MANPTRVEFDILVNLVNNVKNSVPKLKADIAQIQNVLQNSTKNTMSGGDVLKAMGLDAVSMEKNLGKTTKTFSDKLKELKALRDKFSGMTQSGFEKINPGMGPGGRNNAIAALDNIIKVGIPAFEANFRKSMSTMFSSLDANLAATAPARFNKTGEKIQAALQSAFKGGLISPQQLTSSLAQLEAIYRQHGVKWVNVIQQSQAKATQVMRQQQEARIAAAQDAEQRLMNLSYRFTHIGMQFGMIGDSLMKAFKGPVEGAKELSKTLEYTAAISSKSIESYAYSLQQLTDATLSLGAGQTIYGINEIAEGLKTLTQAGMDTEAAIKGVVPILDFASAGQLSLADASRVAISTMTAFRLGVEDLPQITGQIAMAANTTNAEVRDFGDALKYVGPLGEQLGMSLSEVLGVLGQLSQAGIRGSMGGTTFRNIARVLLQAEDASTKAGRALMELGIQIKETDPTTGAVRFRNFANILDQFKLALEKLPDPVERAAKMVEIFQHRAGPGMLALLSQGSGELKDLQERIAAVGDNSFIAARRSEGFYGAMERMKKGWEGLNAAFGMNAAGVLGAFANQVALLTGSLIKLAQEVPVLMDLAGTIVLLAGAFGTLFLATKGLTLFVSTLASMKVLLAALRGGMLAEVLMQTGGQMTLLATQTTLAGDALGVMPARVTATTAALAGLKAMFTALFLTPIGLFLTSATALFLIYRNMDLKNVKEQTKTLGELAKVVEATTVAMDRVKKEGTSDIEIFSKKSYDQQLSYIKKLGEANIGFYARQRQLEIELARIRGGLFRGLFEGEKIDELEGELAEIGGYISQTTAAMDLYSKAIEKNVDKQKTQNREAAISYEAAKKMDTVTSILGDSSAGVESITGALAEVNGYIDDTIGSMMELGFESKAAQQQMFGLSQATTDLWKTYPEVSEDMTAVFSQIKMSASQSFKSISNVEFDYATSTRKMHKDLNEAKLQSSANFFTTYMNKLADVKLVEKRDSKEGQEELERLNKAKLTLYKEAEKANKEMLKNALKDVKEYTKAAYKAEMELAQGRIDLAKWVADMNKPSERFQDEIQKMKALLDEADALGAEVAAARKAGNLQEAEELNKKRMALLTQASKQEAELAAQTLEDVDDIKKKIEQDEAERTEMAANLAATREKRALAELKSDYNRQSAESSVEQMAEAKAAMIDDQKAARALQAKDDEIQKNRDLLKIKERIASSDSETMRNAKAAKDEREARDKDGERTGRELLEQERRRRDLTKEIATDQIAILTRKAEIARADQAQAEDFLQQVITYSNVINKVWEAISLNAGISNPALSEANANLAKMVDRIVGDKTAKDIQKKFGLTIDLKGDTNAFDAWSMLVKDSGGKTGGARDFAASIGLNVTAMGEQEAMDLLKSRTLGNLHPVEVPIKPVIEGVAPGQPVPVPIAPEVAPENREAMLRDLKKYIEMGLKNNVALSDIIQWDSVSSLAKKLADENMKVGFSLDPANAQKVLIEFVKKAEQEPVKVELEVDTKKAETETKGWWSRLMTWMRLDATSTGAPVLPKKATGGLLPGYGGGDRRMILAEDGEFIVRKEAVKKYGADRIAAINQGRIDKFAKGGIVGRSDPRLKPVFGTNEFDVYSDQPVSVSEANATIGIGDKIRDIIKAQKEVFVYTQEKFRINLVSQQLLDEDDNVVKGRLGHYNPEDNSVWVTASGGVPNVDVIEHEISHANMSELGPVPSWFNEGLAMYLEDLGVSRRSGKASQAPFKMPGVVDYAKKISPILDSQESFSKEAIQDAYMSGFAAVLDLQAHGILKDVIQDMSDGMQLEDSLRKRYPRTGEVAGKGFALGGVVGGSGSGDIVPALLEPGEYVLPKAAVRGIGVSALEALRSLFIKGGAKTSDLFGIQKFANGGLVGATAGAAGGGGNTTLYLDFSGKKVGPLTGQKSVIDQLTEALRRESLTR